MKISAGHIDSSLTWFLAAAFPLALAAGLVMQSQKLLMVIYASTVLLPFAYLVLFRFNLLIFITILAIPLSVKFTAGGTVVSLPGEILAGAVAIIYLVYRLVSSGNSDNRVLRHPVTVLLLMDLGWLVFSAIFSELPLISLKRIAVRMVFLILFYFVFLRLFKDSRNIVRVMLLYGIGLVIPIITTLYDHSHYEFSKVVAFEMTKPFYNDHTQYSACIAFIIPLFILLAIKPGSYGFRPSARLFFLPLLVLLVSGEIFSFSRAAWLSLIVAFGLYILVLMRVRLWHLVVFTLLGMAVVFYYQTEIYRYFEKVDAVSRHGNVERHLESVMNIETDASNMERINRWKSAWRMFQDRPLTGFGPGTYQFVYGKYQLTTEMTRISTNTGNKGNAHNEFLTYMSETGMPGFVIFNILLLMNLSIALRIINTTRKKEVKWLTVALLLGFVSYFFHGLFNSFLDTDKAAVLVFGCMAGFTALDLYHRG